MQALALLPSSLHATELARELASPNSPRKMLTRRQRQTLLPQSPLDDPALLAPLFAALPAKSLLNAACVCKAWAAAEQVDRSTLWKRFVVQQYPALAAVSRPKSDWKARFSTLAKKGVVEVEDEEDEEPLERFEFVFQGSTMRGDLRKEILFSKAVATSKATMQGDDMTQYGNGLLTNPALNQIEIRDALKLDLTLDAPMRFPAEYQEDASDDGNEDCVGFDVEILVYDRTKDKVAHFLAFTLPRAGIIYRGDPDGSEEEAYVPIKEMWDAPLPDSFETKIDTQVYRTNIGVGPREEYDGSRAEPGFVGGLGGVELGDFASTPGVEVHPLRLGLQMIEGAPHLKSISMQVVMQMAVNGNMPQMQVAVRIPVQVNSLSALPTELDWA